MSRTIVMKNVKKIVAVALVLVTVLTAFTACSFIQSKKLIGTWKDESGSYGCTFNKDGTCKLNVSIIGNVEVDGTYETSTNDAKENVVTVTYSISVLGAAVSYTKEFKYNIDGDNLTLIDESGSSTVYTAVK